MEDSDDIRLCQSKEDSGWRPGDFDELCFMRNVEFCQGM